MPETQKTKGGCYQSGGSIPCPGYGVIDTQHMSDHGLDWEGWCNVCGRNLGHLGSHGDVVKCDGTINNGYSVTCGYTNGAVVEAIIKY